MRTNYIVYLNYKKQKNTLRPQCNTTNARPCNSSRETKEEQNNYQLGIQKLQEQIDIEADKWDIRERHNSSKLR